MHIKGSHKQNKRTTYRMGEKKIAKDATDNQKMVQRPKQTFLQRHTDGKHAHEKIFNISN